MDQLTPELERRLQVEELWARRNVLADSINARRKERFHAQQAALFQLGTPFAPAGTPVPKQIQREGHAEASKPGKIALSARIPSRTVFACDLEFNWWRAAPRIGLPLAVVLAAVGLALAPLRSTSVAMVEARFEKALLRATTVFSQSTPNQKKLLATSITRRSMAIPNLRAEVAAEIAHSLQRRGKNPDALPISQSN
jgi:hypothetical protein